MSRPPQLEILVPHEGEKTVPTIRVGHNRYHVVLTDFEVAYDMDLTSGETAAIVTYWTSPSLEDWPTDEKYSAEIKRRFAQLQMPRKLAVGYGAARGLLGNLPKPVVDQLGRYWKKFAAEVMRAIS